MKLTSTFIFLILMNFTSNFDKCSKVEPSEVLEEECISYQIAPITNVKEYTPEKENEDYYYEINFLVKNGCGVFGNFIKETKGDSLHISINAKYAGCVCTLAMQELTTFFQFEDAENISVIKFIGDVQYFEIEIK